MNGIELVVALLSSAGFIAGIAGIIKTVLDHKRGVQSSETEAEERHITRLEARITHLEETLERKTAENNELLQQYINVVQEKIESDKYVNVLTAKLVDNNVSPPPR